MAPTKAFKATPRILAIIGAKSAIPSSITDRFSSRYAVILKHYLALPDPETEEANELIGVPLSHEHNQERDSFSSAINRDGPFLKILPY